MRNHSVFTYFLSVILPFLTGTVLFAQVPEITGLTQTLSVSEDGTLVFSLNYLAVTDADNTYPDDFTLEIQSGTNYSFSGNSVTPSNNFNGSINVNVRVFDGVNWSNSFAAPVTVNAVNDPPVATNDVGTTAEETPIALNVLSNDLDVDDGLNLTTVNITTPTSNGSLAVNTSSGIITYAPNLDFNGTDIFSYTVNDNGGLTSNAATVTINITAVNDPPTFNTISNVTISEDAGSQAINVSGISPGPGETENVIFTATSNNTALIPNPVMTHDGISSTGTLAFQPVANQSGTATITVLATDNQSATFSRTFNVIVNAVNDAPTLDVISNVTVNEDAALQSIPLTGISAGGGESQNLTVTVTSDNPSLFQTLSTTYTSANATGTLNVQPAANAFGVAMVTVTVQDNGSSTAPNVNALSRTFTYTVNAVNDPPVITAQSTLSTNEDVSLPVLISNITITDPDNSSFTLTLQPGTNYTISGNTTIVPALNFSGTLTVGAVVNDGQANSNTFPLTVTVNPVNDAPTLNAISNVTVLEDAAPTTISLTGISAGGSESQTLTVEAATNAPSLFEIFSLTYASPNGTGSLIIKPNANLSGPATVTVTVRDNGSNVAPHINTFSRTFNFNVTPVNDPPSFNAITNYTVNEDAALQNVIISNISPGPQESQNINFTATSSNTTLIPNPTISYTNGSATATLSYQPQANQFGSSIITVTATDEELGVFSRQFTVTVNAVNDPPTLDPISNVTIDEDAPQQAISLTGISAGPSETQTLIVSATATQPALFDVFSVSYSSPASSGTLNIKPKLNIVGTTNITVTVQDNSGGTSTVSRTFSLTINPVNDPPVIKGQSALSVNEDQSIAILVSHLQIEDPDNSSGFSLNLANGSNYSLSGNTVIPAQNFNGTLSVPVTVSDGTSSSSPFNLQITVIPVNDAPQIIGQNPINTGESQPVPLSLNQLTVIDPDNSYPADFSLNVLSGANYSVTGNTVTPIANFSGTLTVRVFVNDGQLNSNTFNLQIQVNSVNDAPIITGQNTTLSVNEDQSLTLLVTHLNITDPDNNYPNDFTLTVLAGSNYTFSGKTITPSLNYSGLLQVAVTVSDGLASSSPFNMQVTVIPVNDAPQITGQQALSTNEDQPIVIKLADLNVTDPDNNYPSGFTMQAASGSNYTVSGLTITPSLNFNGMLSVPVTVNDGAANSNTFNLQIQVTASNDSPIITGQTPALLTINEDQSFVIAFSNLIVTDPDNTYPTGFSIAIQSGNNYTFSGTTVTPNQNFTGAMDVKVVVSDGSNNSNSYNYKVQVTAINDPPVITGQQNVSVNEDESITLSLNHLIVTDPDNTYPTGFTMTVLAGTNYTFSGLNVTPSPNFFGTLTVKVQVNDGAANSNVYNLQLQVVPVNDPPSFDAIEDIVLTENAGLKTFTVTNISSGPLESQQLLLTVTSGNTTLIPQQSISVTYNGNGPTATVSFSSAENRTGTAIITVKVVDPGLSEFSRTFIITIEDINDAPTLDVIAYGPILEDAPLQTIPLTGITAGPQENQVLVVSASSNKPELFEILTVTYTSPQNSGTLNIKPKANAFGSASITVKVTDDGSNVAPHINFIQRTFTLQITSVNDAPVFITTPVTTAIVGDLYSYSIETLDNDPGDVLTISAPQKPAWLSLTPQGNGKVLLQGIPPTGTSGAVPVIIQVRDVANSITLQEFEIEVDSRPVVSNFSISTSEDTQITLGATKFVDAFADADNNSLQHIEFVRLPEFGSLKVGGQLVTLNSDIEFSMLNSLTYTPHLNYFGKDTASWVGSDGIAYSSASADILITISPVNDPPEITNLETEVLDFIVGDGPQLITPEFDAIDVDDINLTGAEIGFRRQNFVMGEDVLLFVNTGSITGLFDGPSGVLTLSGVAPVSAYVAAIRSIKYDNLSEVFLSEEVIKTVSITLSDGKMLGITKDREIKLIDSYIELVVPKAFTPNGDTQNDNWVIENIDRHVTVSVRVYTVMGQEVFASEGVYVEWDGTYQGEKLPVDTYYYTIDMNLPQRKKTYRGTVLILR